MATRKKTPPGKASKAGSSKSSGNAAKPSAKDAAPSSPVANEADKQIAVQSPTAGKPESVKPEKLMRGPGKASMGGPLARRERPVRVVAIGASAGGLEPLEEFFEAMPIDSGLAFIVIQHLSPDFRSMMDQLLARHSSMKILHAEDGMTIKPNEVYLNPPRTDLTIKSGKFYTQEYSSAELLTLPIDTFFHSLADDQGERAVGIVLSGTGSDGARGCQAIRDHGGTVIVQEPSSAKFNSMPRAAIDRHAATAIALPKDMPGLLMRLIGGDSIEQIKEPEDRGGDPERRVLTLLERQYGADFGYYKHSTVNRRIRRRALLNQMSSLEQYAQFVGNDPNELEALYCDLLIGVTAFFRDSEAYKLLKDGVLPELAGKMTEKRPLRVWTAGCASGEEPYSIAILISEFAREHGLPLNVKIFATDIHFNSLDTASAGLYTKDALTNISDEYLERYFDLVGGNFQVKPALRKMIVFSPHNLIKDPPFTRMDLVTCRNLLIYLDDVAQRKVLAMFHFALRKEGVLFLGPSETTSDFGNEFETLSKKWRFFRKKRDVRLRESTELLPLSYNPTDVVEDGPKYVEIRSSGYSNMQVLNQKKKLLDAYDKVLEKYAPPSFLLDTDGDLVHIFGNADLFLRLRSGVFSKKIVDMLIPELKLVIGVGIERASTPHTADFQRRTAVTLANGEERTVNIEVSKLLNETNQLEFILVTLMLVHKEAPVVVTASPSQETDSSFFSTRIGELERDLKSTEESLQSTIEELETSNEELQATNEELMASNEELQSTNEELHSVNEELFTVSAEHQRKIEELTEITEDMDNLLRATNIGTVFLDSELKIRRFTPAAADTFNLVTHDIGRPFEHITYRFPYANLKDDVEKVRVNGIASEREIDVDGRAYLLRILPYASNMEDNNGAVLTVVDVHELQEAKHRLEGQQRLYADVVDQQHQIIIRFKPDTTIVFANEAYCRYYGKTRDELIGQRFIDLVPEHEREAVLESIAGMKPGDSNEHERTDIRPDGSVVWLEWHRNAIVGTDGEISEIQAVGRDITAIKDANQALEAVNDRLAKEEERFRRLYRHTPVMMYSIDENGAIIEASEYWFEVMGYKPDEVIGRKSVEFLTKASRKHAETILPEFWKNGACHDIAYQMVKKDGTVIDVLLSAIVDEKSGPQVTRSLAVVVDVTDLLSAEKALAEQNAELARINDNLNQFTHIVSHDLTGPLRAIEHTTNWIEEDTNPEARSEIQVHIDRLKDQVLHLSSMLNDLLEYSRAGASDQSPEDIDLPRELNDLFDVIDKPTGMSLEIRSVPKNLVSHRTPLLLIFRNLIENAVKYHDRDTGRITITNEDLGDKWVFSIEDDGPGIIPKFHEKILLPFRKLQRKTSVPGNGMGLALVKKAVESNGGELSIRSDPEVRRGTAFTFTWPKNRAEALAAE